MKKNDVLVGECVDYTYDGQGVVKTDDFTFFVPYVLKGEMVRFKILKLKKNYGYGKLIEVLETSRQRVIPSCPVFYKCGGCNLQHMSLTEQLEFKKQLVMNNLEKIGGIACKVNDCLGMSFKPYRNKAQYPVQVEDGKLKMGFYRAHSNDIVDIDHCMIQQTPIDEVFRFIKKHLANYYFNKDVRHVVIKYSHYHDEMMIVFVCKENLSDVIMPLVDKLVKKFSFIKSVILNLNNRNTNVILGDDEYLLYGDDHIKEHILGNDYYLASKSFFQVNPYQSAILYEKVLEYADLKGSETVVDMYCGVGSISLCLARKAKKVYGVEIVEEAIENAKLNQELNELTNVEFSVGDAKDYSKWLCDNHIKVDVLVVDPPRKGLAKETIDYIKMINPTKIVYVSCNPATLARDLKEITSDTYECLEATPVDMFPMTAHVESVALLTKV